MKDFPITFDRLFYPPAVHVPFGCVGVESERPLPTQKIIGEWVKCPLCGKNHIYQLDHREDRFKPPAKVIGKCECNPGMVIATGTILDDGKVTVVREQELP